MGGRGLAKLATAGSCLRQPERRRPRAGARQGARGGTNVRMPSSLAHTRSAQPKEGIEKTEPEDDRYSAVFVFPHVLLQVLKVGPD
jgi:hypothetical protein